MGRETARKIAYAPGGDHALVKRDNAGSVATTQTINTTGNTFNNTAVTTLSTLSPSPSRLLFTSHTLVAKNGTTAVTVTVTTANGSTLAQTSVGSAGGTSSTTTANNTLDSGRDGPLKVKGKVAGGTGTWTLTLTREQRFV